MTKKKNDPASTGYLIKPVKVIALILAMPYLNNVSAFQQQEKTIRGIVSDENNVPLQGVNITLKGTNRVVVTQADGKYSIAFNGSSAVLQFSFVGYSTQEVKIKNGDIINIKLSSQSKQLNDVVVTGYGKASKKNITGAITSLAPEDFNQGVLTTPAQLLQGKVAGLNITKSGDPNAQPAV